MPFRRKRTFKRKRRFARKRKFRRTAAKTLVIRGPEVVPDRVFVKMKYTTGVTFSVTGVGPIQEYIFRANSLFDPDFTGVGGQPTGFDQWSAFYNKYRVHKSSFRAELCTDSTNAASFVVSVYPSDVSGGLVSIDDYLSAPYTKWSHHSFGGNRTKIVNSMKTKKKLGYKTISNEEDVAALITANPAEQWYWIISVATNNSTDTALAEGYVVITYYAEMYDRIDLNQS